MTLFQQATLLPMLHQFMVILRRFSMFPSVGTMARTHAPSASSCFIVCFQHSKEEKKNAPNQTVYEQAIDHLEKTSNEIQHCCQSCLLEQQGITPQRYYAIGHAILSYGSSTSDFQARQSL